MVVNARGVQVSGYFNRSCRVVFAHVTYYFTISEKDFCNCCTLWRS